MVNQMEGTFGHGKIKMETLPILGSKKLLINVHGAYGSIHGGGKYLDFAKSLYDGENCSVALYESSRNAQKNAGSYKQRLQAFEGKTFEDELEDARRVVLYYIQNSEELFGVSAEELEITMNGNSLGGIIALVLANEIPQITKVSTVGTGLCLIDKETPLARTFPQSASLVPRIKNFKGKLVVQHGGDDDVFEKGSFQQLYDVFSNNQKGLVFLPDVDHTFTKIKGKKSDKPYDQIYRNVRILVDESRAVGGTVLLQHEDELRAAEDSYEEASAASTREIEELGLQHRFGKTSSYDEDAINNY